MVNKKDPGKDRKKSEEEKGPLEEINYPPEEDIMNPASGATRVVPEETNHDRVNPGDTLDVPGSELDDDMEDIGEEDEENNYYSLGGDKED